MENTVLSEKYQDNSIKHETRVPFIDLKRQYYQIKHEILDVVDSVLSSGTYILGDVVEIFEKEIAKYLGCKYVLCVANGTDAIILALKCLKIGHGDEVILPTNSFVATAGAVVAVGATPVLCDVQNDLNINTFKIESLITKNTKAIIPVHLTGRPADMDKVNELAKHYSLAVIEDAAQSIGARYNEKMAGTLGDFGCFSLHPLKNLHIYGDGGLISINNEDFYSEIKLLRNHGLLNRDICLQWGINSRLDTIHAGIGLINLKYIDKWNNQRRKTASIYSDRFKEIACVPFDKPSEYAVYHNYIMLVEQRDELMTFLLNQGIETKIHYPIPIHLQPSAKELGYKLGDFPVSEQLVKRMISLPIYSELREDEIQSVVDGILKFYSNKH